jgi:hypothetical protein
MSGPRTVSVLLMGVRLLIAAGVVEGNLALTGCEGEQLIAGRCDVDHDCPSGQRCEQAGLDFHRCVALDASADAIGGDGARADRPLGDGPVDAAGDARDAPADMGSGGDGGPLRCTSSAECQASGAYPTRPFCQAGVCVGCQAADAGTCAPPHPLCDPGSGACVDCTSSAQCTRAGLPYCVAQRCLSCADSGGDSACKLRDPTKPACATSGRCAECANNDHCKAAPNKPFCVGDVCVGCQQAGASTCTGATPACDPVSGACVECAVDADCKQDAAPACVANKCVSCALAAAGKCATLKPTTPACGPAGACVECVASADCTLDPARPICNTANHVCRPCTADAECAARKPTDPGICLEERGGACASEAEVIVVANVNGCGTTGGTRIAPLCQPQDALAQVASNRAVVALHGTLPGFAWTLTADTPPITVVGKETAVLAGGIQSSIRLDGPGDVLVRGIIARSCDTVGVVATGGAKFTLRDSVIDGNRGGGILLDGARFDIRNTTVIGNGPGLTGTTSWGGILALNIPASTVRLDRVSIKDNKQVGLACASAISGSGIYAKNNAGGIEVQDTCAITTCDPESATCGAGPM